MPTRREREEREQYAALHKKYGAKPAARRQPDADDTDDDDDRAHGVVAMFGTKADKFLDRMFGDSTEVDDEDQDDEDQDDDEDDEPDPPTSRGNRFFGGSNRRG